MNFLEQSLKISIKALNQQKKPTKAFLKIAEELDLSRQVYCAVHGVVLKTEHEETSEMLESEQ